jgi:hypothetical protein
LTIDLFTPLPLDWPFDSMTRPIGQDHVACLSDSDYPPAPARSGATASAADRARAPPFRVLWLRAWVESREQQMD